MVIVFQVLVAWNTTYSPIEVQAQDTRPIPEISMFPEPTGPYQVGRTTFHWIDETRDELNTSEEDYSELMVTVWYPAEPEDDAEVAVYREDLNGPSVDEVLDIYRSDRGPYATAMMNLTTHAYQDAPLAQSDEAFPVITFSHGAGVLPGLYSLQLMELASYGYIVAAINHTYYATITVFPDGRVIESVLFDLDQKMQAENTGLEDVTFVLDQLELLNTNNEKFAAKLDMERVGAFGHSMGGAISVLAASQDTRIQALANEDGTIAAPAYPEIEQPYMLFVAEGKTRFTEFASGPKHIIFIDEFEHSSFNDFTVIFPETSSIDGNRTFEIIRRYLVAFFDTYLKGEDMPLIYGSSEAFPEVTVQTGNIE